MSCSSPSLPSSSAISFSDRPQRLHRAGLVPVSLHALPTLTTIPTVVYSSVRARTVAASPTVSIIPGTSVCLSRVQISLDIDDYTRNTFGYVHKNHQHTSSRTNSIEDEIVKATAYLVNHTNGKLFVSKNEGFRARRSRSPGGIRRAASNPRYHSSRLPSRCPPLAYCMHHPYALFSPSLPILGPITTDAPETHSTAVSVVAASQHNPHTPEPTSGPIVSLPTRVHTRGTASLAGLQPETCYRISALFTTPPPRALDRRLI